jgi:AraC-like DNA-binding protein
MAKKKTIQAWSDEFLASLNPEVKLIGYDIAHSYWKKAVPKNEWRRKYHDIWYIHKGTGIVKINNKWLNFSPNQLLLIKQGQNYQGFKTHSPQGHEIYFMHFVPFSRDSHKTKMLIEQWPQIINFKHYPIINDLFAQLFETYTLRPLGYTLQLKALVINLMEKILWTNRIREKTKIKPALYEKVSMAREFIINNTTKDISLENIASSVNLSSSYLSALFHRYFGISPIEYHIICRIKNAKLLLAKGFNVTETADRVGFHSIHQFSKTFKRKIGVCPSEYAVSCPTL